MILVDKEMPKNCSDCMAREYCVDCIPFANDRPDDCPIKAKIPDNNIMHYGNYKQIIFDWYDEHNRKEG